ncbi:MAG: sulfatase-like hydrolase/transferase, partial [Hydrococcus sp. Prado102]|nr:sulfatase-like hydrolase/transferase [Hydrococcus sp. Prado102]
PFLLYYPHTAVHTPIWPGEAFRGKSNNGRFGDWVEEVDWSVGQVLGKLEELDIAKNTLVIFTSDNGPWLIKGSDGGSAGPLRGGKGSTWEGGVRVPTLAWWPGKIAPGSLSDTVTGTIDLLPTAVALAGAQVPAEPTIDGRDISPLLLGKTTAAARDAHYYFAGYTLQAVRQGPWKLAIKPQPETIGKDALDDARRDGPRLYNLDEEIGERTNVADQHPDVVARLQSLIAQMDAEIGGSSPTARRPAGNVDNPRDLYPMVENKTRPQSGKTQSAKPQAAKPMSPEQLKGLPIGATVGASQAPQVAGKAFSISCRVKTDQPDAMILAHGGAIAGYAIFIHDGYISFLVRTGAGGEFIQVVSPEAYRGEANILAELAADGRLMLKTLKLNI